MAGSSVLIIGAGIVGCSAAHYLSQLGVDVVVVDAEGIGGQASAQTAGNIHLQLSYRAMKGTEAEFVHHTRIRDLNVDAAHRWDALSHEFSGRIEVIRRGGVVVAETVSDLEQLKAKVDLENAAGFSTEFLAGDELRARVPELSERVIGGSYHSGEGHVTVDDVCTELAEAAIGDGARFELHCAVTAITKHANGWRVETESGTHLADNVIVCAGAFTERVLALADAFVPMQLAGLTIALTEPVEPFLHTLVMHASRPLSIKQTSSGNVMVGGGRPALLLETSSALGVVAGAIPESVTAGLDDLGRVIERGAELPLARSWQGILGTPGDELPVIGELPGHPGLFVSVAGHNGYTLGPSCGWLVSQLVRRQSPDVDLEPFTPSRFVGAR